MKKLTLLIFLCLTARFSFAQLDVSINPISILFESLDLSAEYGIKNDFGIDATLGYDFGKYDVGDVEVKNTGFGLRLIGKYYFKPDDGLDRWSIGPYVRVGTRSGKFDDGVENYSVTNFKFAVGFYTGYKWVSKKNIVFELGFGAGRAFVNKYTSDEDSFDAGDYPGLNFDVTGRLSLGYRFGLGKN
ncbi:MAG: DUF3575 domain-containing protein [Saprospiraceae bacterium]|nr:DUF3575 domain-containing protein [Saprospiraceae bacterium]